MRRIWSWLALATIRFSRIPVMYRVSSYCAERAGFLGEPRPWFVRPTFDSFMRGWHTYNQLPPAEQAEVEAYLDGYWENIDALCEHGDA